MAKFRQNHGQSTRGTSFMSRAVGTTIGLIAVLILGFMKLGNFEQTPISHSQQEEFIPDITDEINYLPEHDNRRPVHHSYYSLDYNAELEVPNWVAYKLTEASLKVKNVPRAKRFKTDDKVKGRSVKHSDYSHSGYTRGHMAPAGDMAFSERAMQESFFMSNMCPQLRQFNNGIWRELEENVRDWAYDNDELYVVSGPIFNNRNPERIGKAKVAVPDAFFKAILDNEGSKKKAIGFILPHTKSDKHLRQYAVSIDELEAQTGMDFYGELLGDSLENVLEAEVDINKWAFDKKRFKQRVEHWNKEK